MMFQILFRAGRHLLPAAILLFFFSACAQTSVVDNWKSDQPVSNKPVKVAVLAVLPDGLMRKAVEIDVAKILQDKGSPAVPASNISGMSGGIRGEIDPDVAVELLKSAGVDGVVVLFYSGGGRTGNYVRSDYWAEHIGTGMAYNWGRPYFTGFTDVYTIHQGPGWADFQTTALVESSYYDLETKQPVWRIVTETKDTEHADTAADIAKKIARQMRSAGLN